jgi:ABC-type multidrug transport system fused ATPase/permease subunit
MVIDFSNKKEVPPDPSSKQSSKSSIGLVKDLVLPYKKWLLIIFIAMLAETTMSLAAPWPLKIIIDNVIGHQKLPEWLSWINTFSSYDIKTAETLAIAAAITLVVVTTIGSIAGYMESYYTESVAQYVANDLRRRLYHHLQRLSLTYYDSHQIGQIMNTITSDVSTVQDFVASTLLTLLIDSLSIIGMLSLMFYLNWDFALIAVAVTPFLLFFVARFKKTVKKATREVRKDQGNMVAVLQEGLECIRVVNAFGRQEWEEERLMKVSMETVNAALKARRIKAMLSPIVTTAVTICVALVLWRGAELVLVGVMTIGALTVFLSYMSKFFSPVQELAKLTGTIAQATVALERMQTILNTDTAIPQKPNAFKPGKLSGNIVFENVSFAYNPETPVLRNIDLTIKPGQRIGVCGPTGGGKSTVVSLIPRFYDANSGRILIDDVDIKDYDLESLRAQIGFVLQDTVLFYGSVHDNIAYGRTDATSEEIIEAAKLANAHEFITKMPQGYDTLVGERGLTLSGGQRQRIGIARAIVRNAPILILDEPTASLDSEAEKIVMEALEELMKGRTVITIAHRLSTIRDVDKIFLLKDGMLAEEGSHEELMKQDSIYAALNRIQSGRLHTLSE